MLASRSRARRCPRVPPTCATIGEARGIRFLRGPSGIEDAVGIGTDFVQGRDAAVFTWLSDDKGTGRELIPPRTNGAPNPEDFIDSS